jgi:hypothetical protein
MSGHKFKIGQLVNYLGRERAPGVYQSLSYCRQKAKHSNIASRTPTNLTNARLRSTSFVEQRDLTACLSTTPPPQNSSWRNALRTAARTTNASQQPLRPSDTLSRICERPKPWRMARGRG